MIELVTVWRCFYQNGSGEIHTSCYVETEAEANKWLEANPNTSGYYDSFNRMDNSVSPIEVLRCTNTGKIIIINQVTELRKYD